MRNTYHASELRAGRTIFVVTSTIVDHVRPPRYGVAEYLVASKREPQPQPGEAHPYRMHPKVAWYACTVTDAWRSRRAALREAARRQAAADRYFSSRSA
jgi:hypothetical protein